MLLQIEMVSVHWGRAAPALALVVADAAHAPIAALLHVQASPAAAALGLSFYGKVLPLNGRQHVGVLRLETSLVPHIALRVQGAAIPLCAYSFELNEVLFRRGVVFANDAGLPPSSVAVLCSRVLNHANTAVRLVNIGSAVRKLACAHLGALAAARAASGSALLLARDDPWDATLRVHARAHARQLQDSYMAGCSR